MQEEEKPSLNSQAPTLRSPPNADNQLEALLRLGETAFRNKEWRTAAKYYKKAIKRGGT
jgi:uncharacterized protein HemY